MARYRVQGPDGKIHVFEGPDGATPEQVEAFAAQTFGGQASASAPPVAKPAGPGAATAFVGGLGQGVGNAALGGQYWLGRGLRAAGDAMSPPETKRGMIARAGDWLINDANAGRAKLAREVEQAYGGADSPLAAGAGRIAGEVVSTLPVGGVLAAPLKSAAAAGVAPRALTQLAESVASGGFRAGGAGIATRAAGGAVTGGASAGLADPEAAATGAVIGGALPPGVRAAGAAGNALGRLVRGAPVSPEVAALAGRAAQLGIDVPADRIANSRPLNALAASLNYVPLSGRQAVERRMADQVAQAASRTIGQDTPNLTKAVRDARGALGAEFDRVLKGTGVAFDEQLLQDTAGVMSRAGRELGEDAIRPLQAQVDDLFSKGASGTIDGQAAYNIKRTLDRLASSNRPEAFHAAELRAKLFDALNRSLGPEEAAKFARTRQQYGAMSELEKLAQNGAEGGVSVARLANLRTDNKGLQELADIAAQFVKSREGAHGAAQRVSIGGAAAGLTGWLGGLPYLGAGMAAGRGVNALLDSDAARRAVLGGSAPSGTRALELLARPAPVLLSQ